MKPLPTLDYLSPGHGQRPLIWPWVIVYLPVTLLILLALMSPVFAWMLSQREQGLVIQRSPKIEPRVAYDGWDYITSSPDDRNDIQRKGHVDLTFSSYDFVEFASSSDEVVTQRNVIGSKAKRGRQNAVTAASVAVLLLAAYAWRRAVTRAIESRVIPRVRAVTGESR